ncbi:MAG: hypothetical protein FIA92_09885 [Chloroflexi bacterium]|nr:hypothetical protein [Chloroflexota bacterium]
MYRLLRCIVVLTVAGLMVVAATVPAAAAQSTTRPFSGSLVGGAAQVPDAGCPFGVRTEVWGIGQVTHLGRTSMTASHCTQFLGAPETGVQTFVAANGDRLEMSYVLTSDPYVPVEGAVLTLHGQTVVTGGTGRFAQASGEFIVNSRAILHFTAPIELWLSWHGQEISY